MRKRTGKNMNALLSALSAGAPMGYEQLGLATGMDASKAQVTILYSRRQHGSKYFRVVARRGSKSPLYAAGPGADFVPVLRAENVRDVVNGCVHMPRGPFSGLGNM